MVAKVTFSRLGTIFEEAKPLSKTQGYGKKKHTLVDNADEKRYEFDLGDDIAIIEYIKTQGFIILTHTEVPEKYEGQGIGAELVHDVLEDLRAKKLQMIPQCPFIAQYIRRHPEWVDVVLKEIPAK